MSNDPRLSNCYNAKTNDVNNHFNILFNNSIYYIIWYLKFMYLVKEYPLSLLIPLFYFIFILNCLIYLCLSYVIFQARSESL